MESSDIKDFNWADYVSDTMVMAVKELQFDVDTSCGQMRKLSDMRARDICTMLRRQDLVSMASILV